MNRRFFYFSSQHNLLVRLLIFFVSVGLIVFILPREEKFKYEFILGKTWLHEDLHAPFSVAIKKSKAEMEAETEEVLFSSKNYYEHDDRVLSEKKKLLPVKLDAFINKLPNTGVSEKLLEYRERVLAEGPGWLEEIYRKGIIGNSSGTFSVSSPDLIIEIRENIAEEKQTVEYYTKESALNYIAVKLYGKTDWEDPNLKLFFKNFIDPNILYNDKLTQAARQKLKDNISPTRGMVAQGELIISRGDVITPEKFQVLDSVRDDYESHAGTGRADRRWLMAGQFLLVSIIMGMLLLFLILLRKDLFEDAIQLSFLFTLIVTEVFLVKLVSGMENLSIYLFPFCMLPILIRAFFDTRLALFAHVVTILITGVLVPNPFEFVIIQIIGGMVCIFSIVNLRKRSQLFLTVGLLFSAYVVCHSGFVLMTEGRISSINLKQIGWLAGSASLTLFSYPVIYLIEKIFGFTSDVSLLELSDTNNPLLKELALKSPGTFQHSLQVANLAEAAIYKIGGNSLLTHTGALYHDIGKMELARYFIENQMTGVNPHDELDFDESARIIISHVKRGIRLARKYNLPEQIIDFIRTHHGTSRVQYFYKSFLKSYPHAEVSEGAFRYPGPIPYSRETAVVMMADAVEATSRSLKNIDSEQIDSMVERVINEQIADNQFVDADITFKDITRIKKIFKKMLMNIYHIRVEYPK